MRFYTLRPPSRIYEHHSAMVPEFAPEDWRERHATNTANHDAATVLRRTSGKRLGPRIWYGSDSYTSLARAWPEGHVDLAKSIRFDQGISPCAQAGVGVESVSPVFEPVPLLGQYRWI